MASQAMNNEDLTIDKLFSVKDFTAVVTGGATGIGLMITQGLVANGATVIITGRRKDALQNVVEKYSRGGKIIGLPCDLTKKDQIKSLADEVSKLAPKGVHLLVNNHGIAVDDHTKFSNVGMPDMNSSKSIAEHLWKSDPQSWMDTWETNVMSPFFVSAAFIPLLSKASDMSPKYSPSIINITSISGLMKGSSGGQFAYASSKAAFIHLNRQLATTLTNCKIRVNTIAPGIFPSEMTAMEPSNENQKSSLGGKPSNAAKRYGNDADMAATVLYLAGPGGCFLNNQIITLDGGHTLTSPAAI